MSRGIALALSALLAAAAMEPQEQPVVRVTSRLVQVSVIVQDRKGEAVADLTRSDFVLLEEGREQPISLFSVESNEPVAAPRELLPANTFSNYLERRGGMPTSVTVILLDGLNTRFEDQAYAKAQLVKFLQQLQPQDRLAIYTLGANLRILHDFTNSTASLLRALARFSGRSSSELEASNPEEPDTGSEELDNFLREANQRMSDFYTIRRVERTLGALEAIANHLYRIPGRKNLIWVSGGFPFTMGLDSMEPGSTAERRTFSTEVERTARAVNNANLAIYPVDARGLIGVFEAYPQFSASSPSRSRAMGPPTARRPAYAATHDTMMELAERTGGRAFYNSNDIKGAIRRAIEDSRVTYVLGYYPKHDRWDGSFREIKVRVKRPGLHLRHRNGYFALPEETLGETQRKAVLAAAAGGPLDATSLGLLVRVAGADAARPRSIRLEIGIRANEVRLEPRAGQWVGELDVVFVQHSAEGVQVAGTSETVKLRFPRPTYEQIVQTGMVLHGQLDLVPAAQQLRIVVRDAGSGAIGSVSIPLSQFHSVNPPASKKS